MKIDYPILPSDHIDSDEFTKEELIAKYYGHKNRFGFFPIGRLNSWHGGIHIEGSSTVRAIADGRIIAYRIPKDYLTEKDTDRQYTNSFILIQHHFETPKKQKIRFYSLYMHLLPKKQMEQTGNVPDLYAQYSINVKTDKVPLGTIVRRYSPKVKDTYPDNGRTAEYMFIPRGSVIKEEKNVPDTHWTKTVEKYKKVYKVCVYKTKKICINKNYLINKGDNNWMVKHTAKEKDRFTTSTTKGAMIFDSIEGTYIGMECKDTELKIEQTKNKNWYKIKKTEQYILVKDCTPLSKKTKDDVVFDTTQNVDTSIKAGQVIGIPGKYEFEKQKYYNTLHLEVFTDDTEIENLINNVKKDNSRTTYIATSGQTLQLAKPCNFLKANTKVKIYQTKGDYTQIGFEDVFYEIANKTTHLHWTKKRSIYVNGKKKTKSTYTIIKEHFDTVNNELENLLPNENTKVYLKKQLAGSKRIIGYGTVQSGQKYWVPSSEVTGEIEQWVSLTADITTFYEKEPADTDTDTTLTQDIGIRKTANIKDNDAIEWWKVKGKKTHTDKQGWIKKSELTEINPFDWTSEHFGWELLQDPDNIYFYQFGNTVTSKNPKDLVKKVWQKLTTFDTDRDKVLSVYELQKAMTSQSAIYNLSKLICQHASEWNTASNMADFKDEVLAIYQKGIDQEEVTAEKQAMTEARDAKIVLLEDKIKNLCFWDQITSGDIIAMPQRREAYIDSKYNPKKRIFPKGTSAKEILLGKEFDELEKERIPRQFPSDSNNIYHLHPIAFVEHMKLISAPTTPPWLEVALAEAKKANYIEEKHSPLSSMIKSYHTYANYPQGTHSTAWCSSFVNWCLNESGNKNIKSAGSQSVLWNEGKLFKRIEEPEFGCIVLFTNYVQSNGKQTSFGHVSFLYGKDKKGDLICLGGNQGNRIKYSRYYTDKVCSTFKQFIKSEGKSVMVEQKFNGFFLPIGYPAGNNTELKEVDITRLNNELAGKAVKSDNKNESTR
ncbi:TIGR02594 family protein [Aquimarina longa]|uniref:TIGR02594 family protein n=1 Tax=Aquimarina longa TaxID=1080221 RepID=UPI000783DBE9|nr:TIGR02594 family protein [Aquimarina longa]